MERNLSQELKEITEVFKKSFIMTNFTSNMDAENVSNMILMCRAMDLFCDLCDDMQKVIKKLDKALDKYLEK